MSITFSILESDTVRETVTKRYCHELYPGLDDEYFDLDPRLGRDDGGYFELVSDWPIANFTESNAIAVLELAGLRPESSGIIALEAIPSIKRQLLRSLNLPARLERASYEGYTLHAADHPKVISMGAGAPPLLGGSQTCLRSSTGRSHSAFRSDGAEPPLCGLHSYAKD